MKQLVLSVLWGTTVLSAPLLARDTLRVCTYNVLNYSYENEDGRTLQYRRLMEEIQPDILVVQEIANEIGGNIFYEGVFIGEPWDLAFGYLDKEDTENMLYFNETNLELQQVHQIAAGVRDISEYTLFLKNEKQHLIIYSVHLKAGDSDEDEAARSAEIDSLLARIGTLDLLKKNILVVGDFNFYSTAEPGYQKLLAFNNPPIIDPQGPWVRNREEYASFYTQSTRTTPLGYCGGGVGGGMDDRFDFIVASNVLAESIIPGSYTVFGNDGQNRLNSAIDDPMNTSVSSEIAYALYCVSDHLPVFADVVIGEPTSVLEENQDFSFRIYPNPVTEESVAEFRVNKTTRYHYEICDLMGRAIYNESGYVQSGETRHKIRLLNSGVYFVMCRIGSSYLSRSIVIK